MPYQQTKKTATHSLLHRAEKPHHPMNTLSRFLALHLIQSRQVHNRTSNIKKDNVRSINLQLRLCRALSYRARMKMSEEMRVKEEDRNQDNQERSSSPRTPNSYPEQKRPNTAEHGEHHAIDAQKPAPAPPNNHAPRKRGRIPLFAFARLPPLPPPSPVAAAAVPSKPLVPTSAILQSLSPTRLMPPAKNLKQIPRFVTTTYTMTGVTESSSPAAASAAARSVSSTPSPPASKALKRRELPIPVAMVPVKQESDDADADDAGDSKTHRRTFSFSSTSSLYSTTTKKAKKTDTAAAAMRSTRNRTDRVSGTAAEGEDEGTAVLRSRKSFDRLSRALVAGVAKGMSAFSRNGAGVGGGVEADSSRSGVMREPKEEGKGMEKEMEMGDDEEIGWAAFLQSDEMGHGDDERRVPATLTADRTSLGRRSATTTTTGNQRSSSDVKQTQTIPRRKSRLLMMATTSSSTLGHAFSSRFGGGGAKRVEREDSIKDAEGWTPAAAMSPRRRKFSEASWGDSPMAMLGRDDSMNGEKSTRGTCDVGKGSPKVVGNAATTHLERSGTSPSSRYDHPLRLLKHGLAWGAMKRTTTSTSTSAQARIISRPYPFHHHQLVPSLCETSRLSDQSTTTGTTASHPSSSMSMSYHERVATPTLSVGKKALLIAEDDQGGRETARLETLARLEGRSSNDDVATDHEKALDYKGGWVLGLAFAKQVGAV
ncbi:hypothetical protein QFC21_001560 [Naganishia friedmannii]|uniref:Uncharacterized protein n=1 Tax=Naganishia friedmannii TaxID=89922 RepID=A0ACC2W586_9TREE|nr:hypothetical protein QFC21_001560 [Naganishia friedmannii]